MALQTREQHIKRDRATSNICTSQVLLAVMASMYGVFHGPEGLKNIALKIHYLTVTLEKVLAKIGVKQLNKNFFDTLLIEGPSHKIKPIAEKNKINFNYIDDNHFSISINESTSKNEIQLIVDVIAKANDKSSILVDKICNEIKITSHYLRKTKFLETKIFNTHHSETSIMRYIKSLEKKIYLLPIQ
jgi:glycine dehydrogenase